MSKRNGGRGVAVFALTLAIIAGMVPGAGAQEAAPLVDLDLGMAYSENFNAGDGGWTAVKPTLPAVEPPNSSWAHGVPTSGPGVAFSGTNVWATNLAGNYLASDCGAILSPPIDLTGATSASMSFQQWRHMEQSTATSTAFDAGMLFVSTDGGATFTLITPDGGYTSGVMSTTARACLQAQPTGAKGLSGALGTTPPPAVYSPVSASLASFVGQSGVQVAIAFGSDASVHRAGWYIDDFTVTTDAGSTVQDFETSDGGFSIVGTKPPVGGPPLGWEHGTPAAGPAGSGTLDAPLWGTKTDADGDHGSNECSSITSPVIDLAANLLATKATLAWKQWFNSSTTTAGGQVQVDAGEGFKTLRPVGDYPEDDTSTTLDACLNDGSDTTPAFDGALNAEPSDMIDVEADLTPFIGGTVQLRFLFASTSSTTSAAGWFVDDVNIALKLFIAQPAIPDLGLPGGADAPGWTSGGTASSWAYGPTTTGPVGESGYATNLGGNFNPSECSYIDSPAIPGQLLAGSPTLTFQHWHEIGTVSSTSAFDGGAVFTSVDNGATWQFLALPEYNSTSEFSQVFSCFGITSAEAVFTASNPAKAAGDPVGMDTVTADLSSLVGAATVKVRFALATSTVVETDGWFINSVVLGGVPVLQ